MSGSKFITSFILLILLFSCDIDETDNMQKNINITRVFWIYENIDITYFNGSFNDATCFLHIRIQYAGDSITYRDIEYAKFYPGDDTFNYWNIDVSSAGVDTEKKLIDTVNNIHYSTQNGSMFPVGPMTFEIKLRNNNKIIKYQFDIPEPGSLSSNNMKYVYNEDLIGSIYSNYSLMVKRAIIGICTKTESTLAISFSSNDIKLFNGWILFYDSNMNYTGNSDLFKQYGNGSLALFVNNGVQLYNDGQQNDLLLSASNINFQPGKTFSDISNFHIVLTDGEQYLGTSNTFDCRSFSVKKFFNP